MESNEPETQASSRGDPEIAGYDAFGASIARQEDDL